VRLGGLLKTSALDFPGRLSAVVFAQGCNFRCPYCHNPDLVPASGRLEDLEAVMAFLRRRRGLLDGVVVSGGEPTLQPGLPAFLRAVKDLGYLTKLDTNGSRPAVVARLLAAELVDHVALDLKADPAGYPPELAPPEQSRPVSETLKLLLAAGRPVEFRITCAAPFVDEAVVQAVALAAAGPWTLHLQRCRLERTLAPALLARRQPDEAELLKWRDLARQSLSCEVR
jgi:pyruvate formate lyase activating enzyme